LHCLDELMHPMDERRRRAVAQLHCEEPNGRFQLQQTMKKTLTSLAAALVLAACAAPFGGAGIAPGAPRDEVMAKLTEAAKQGAKK